MAPPPRVLAASLALLALLLAQAATAGSGGAPEISDRSGDQMLTLPAGGPQAIDSLGLARAADLVGVWLDNETAHAVRVHIRAHDLIAPVLLAQVGPVQNIGPASYDYEVAGMVGDRVVSAGAVVGFDSATDPTSMVKQARGAATNVTVSGVVLTFDIPRESLGNATAGAQLTHLYATVTGTIYVLPASVATITDRAPDSGYGANYTFTMDTAGSGGLGGVGGASGGDGGGPARNPNGAPGCTYRSSETNRSDADADCLPDWWEKQYFGNLAQNGTGDPDHDGCDNRCEYLHGTDPTKADTDGDGTSDGAEIAAGTDPTNPASHPSPASGSDGGAGAGPDPNAATPPPAGSTAKTTTAPTTAGFSGTTAQDHGAQSLQPASADDSPLGRIQADAGYAVASVAAMAAVVLLSLAGLLVRWG